MKIFAGQKLDTIFKVILFILLVQWTACKHHATNSEDPMYQEVMTVHDKVMPELSTIHSLKKKLKSYDLPNSKELIHERINQLNDADEAMMDWMAAFKVPEDANKDTYLKSEKDKIQLISDQMYKAIEDAKNLIDSLDISKPQQ